MKNRALEHQAIVGYDDSVVIERIRVVIPMIRHGHHYKAMKWKYYLVSEKTRSFISLATAKQLCSFVGWWDVR